MRESKCKFQDLSLLKDIFIPPTYYEFTILSFFAKKYFSERIYNWNCMDYQEEGFSWSDRRNSRLILFVTPIFWLVYTPGYLICYGQLTWFIWHQEGIHECRQYLLRVKSMIIWPKIIWPKTLCNPSSATVTFYTKTKQAVHSQ